MAERWPAALERRRGWFFAAIVFGALLCAVIAVGAMVVIGAIAFSDTDDDDVSPQVVENVARIRLPPRVSELRSHLQGFQDRLIWVRFRMPEDELLSFERSLTCRLAAPTSVPATLPSVTRPEWWTEAKLSRSCQGRGPGFDQTVIVDLTAAPALVVLVVVIET